MTERILAIGDIHGCGQMLEQLLARIAPDPRTGHAIGKVQVRNRYSSTTGMHHAPVESLKEMDIPVMHCDKRGSQIRKMVMKDVSYLKGANFNLCSLPKMMEEGWVMGQGRRNHLAMRTR